MKYLEKLRMNLALTPFERKMIIFFFLMIFLGDIYNHIRKKDEEKYQEESALFFDEDKIVKININSAPMDSLILLPGIGKKTAEEIIEIRKKEKFLKPEDLLRVKGIGVKKLERIKPYILLK